MRLLITDLDGTLLDDKGKLPPTFDERVSGIMRDGYMFAIATSRSPQNVTRLFASSRMPITAFCSDGSSVVTIKNGVFETIIEYLHDSSGNRALFDHLEGIHRSFNPWFFTGSADDYRVYVAEQEDLQINWLKTLLPYREWDVVNRIDISNDILSKALRAISFFGDRERIDELTLPKIPGVRLLRYTETRFFDGNYSWIDVIPDRVSKGYALSEYIKTNLGIKHIVALGNSANDIELFEMADLCYCPEASEERLQKLATQVIQKPCGEMFFEKVIAIL